MIALRVYASELELARRVDVYGAGIRGLAQHAVRRYAQALEAVPRALAENAMGGRAGNEVVSKLWAKHEAEGGEEWGVDVEVSGTRFVSRFHSDPDYILRPSPTAPSPPHRPASSMRSPRRRGRCGWQPKPPSACSASTASL